MTTQNVEQQYKEVQANLKEVGDQLKGYAEEAAKATTQARKLSEESSEKVDKLLLAQSELKGRLETAEQLLAMNAGGVSGETLSLGAKAVQDEEFVNSLKSLRSRKGSTSINLQAALINEDPTSNNRRISRPDRVEGIQASPEQRLFIRDLLNWGQTSATSIEYVRETGFTNNAAPVSENPSDGKPESQITLGLDHAPIATIAHWIHASKQVLDDVNMLRAHIDGRLMYGLKLKEEAQLLKGSGSGLNINGIFTQAQTASSMGITVSNETAIDRLRLAMLQVQLAEYASDGIVLNPIDWARIELLKDSQQRYLLANPQGALTPTLWGLPVVSTTSLSQGEYLTGAFRMGAQGWDREDANISVSTEDRDNFIKNMVTILCEERIGLTVYRPEAFVQGDFDTAYATSGL